MTLSGWETASVLAMCVLLGAILESIFRGSHGFDYEGPDDSADIAMKEAYRLDVAATVCLEQAMHGDPVFMWRELYDIMRECDKCGSLLTNTHSPAYYHSNHGDNKWQEFAVVLRSCGNCGHSGQYHCESYAGAIINACLSQDKLEQARESWLASEYDIEPDDVRRGLS